MQNSNYTKTGDRPELAAIPVATPEGFIGTKIVPILPVGTKAGTLYYLSALTNVTAETGRSAGAAPSANRLALSSANVTCTEIISRANIAPEEVPLFGGIESADKAAGAWVNKQVQMAIETVIAASVLASPNENYDSTTFIEQVQGALDGMRLITGRTALVGGTATIKRIMRDLGTTQFKFATEDEFDDNDFGGRTFRRNLMALATYLGVDEVLAGASEVWDTGAIADRVAVVKYDNSGDILSHKYRAVYAKIALYIPDGKNITVVRSAGDPVNVDNLYDAAAWYAMQVFNSSAKYVFDDISGVESSSSSSSSSLSSVSSLSSLSSQSSSSLSSQSSLSSESSKSGV